jgi:thymidylate synthase (FAD)
MPAIIHPASPKIEILACFGDDLMVVNAARVSMAKMKTAFDVSDERLIHYLASARPMHFSPFTHPKVQFRVSLPIFLARQWEKHRIGATRGYEAPDQNEVSRRYVDDQPELFVPREWRKRPPQSIKQGSGGPLDEGQQGDALTLYLDACGHAIEAYNDLLALGVAPEQARMVLPQSTMTQWVETGSLFYWARVYGLRHDPHAQAEWRPLTKALDEVMTAHFPVSWPALTRGDDE